MVSTRAILFLKRIEDGTIKKRSLLNHGFDYTDGSEGIASMRFEWHLGSCSYFLLRNRIGMGARIYYG